VGNLRKSSVDAYGCLCVHLWPIKPACRTAVSLNNDFIKVRGNPVFLYGNCTTFAHFPVEPRKLGAVPIQKSRLSPEFNKVIVQTGWYPGGKKDQRENPDWLDYDRSCYWITPRTLRRWVVDTTPILPCCASENLRLTVTDATICMRICSIIDVQNAKQQDARLEFIISSGAHDIF
jgi:hypothetical protein